MKRGESVTHLWKESLVVSAMLVLFLILHIGLVQKIKGNNSTEEVNPHIDEKNNNVTTEKLKDPLTRSGWKADNGRRPVTSEEQPPGKNNTTSEGPIAAELRLERTGCNWDGMEGTCMTVEECYTISGQVHSLCTHSAHFYCCIVIHTCGGTTKEIVSHFRSPDYPKKSAGSLACDFDVTIHPNICAVRLEYTKVVLARKLGGLCDIDQLLILNSVDGPTSAQCGPLSGYATTVAVNPGQIKPLKLAILVQNEGTYIWDIKTVQLYCSQLQHFKRPDTCGELANDIQSSSSLYTHQNQLVWYRPEKRWAPRHTWWSYPEPIFNTYYYRSTKRHMAQGPPALSRRVVAGSDAALGEFPWTVAIGLDHMFFCGGALISESLVLTAAHCLLSRDTPIGSLVVHVGDLDLTDEKETGHETRAVTRVMFHSHFHPFLLHNDIALLHLDRPALMTDTVQPICLPYSGELHTGEKGTVVGWGVSSFPLGEPSPVLQKLDVEVLTNKECARLIEEPLSPGMICASPAHRQGTCFGDSGGPLSVLGKDGRHSLAGIVSFGVTGCALRPAFPDLYTRITEYLRWVDVNAL